MHVSLTGDATKSRVWSGWPLHTSGRYAAAPVRRPWPSQCVLVSSAAL